MSKQYSKWTLEEQERFKQIVDEIKSRSDRPNWKIVSERMGTKTPRQCYDYHLVHKDKEQEKRHIWTKEEEEMLDRYANQLNRNWGEVERIYFPEFSMSELRNKFNHLNAARVESSFSSVSSSLMSEMSEIPSCITADLNESKDAGSEEFSYMGLVPMLIEPETETGLRIGRFTVFDEVKNDEDISFGHPFEVE